MTTRLDTWCHHHTNKLTLTYLEFRRPLTLGQKIDNALHHLTAARKANP